MFNRVEEEIFKTNGWRNCLRNFRKGFQWELLKRWKKINGITDGIFKAISIVTVLAVIFENDNNGTGQVLAVIGEGRQTL